MNRKRIIIFGCLFVFLIIGTAFAFQKEPLGTATLKVTGDNEIICNLSDDYSQFTTIEYFQKKCKDQLGYVPTYEIQNDEYVFHLWEHNLKVPCISKKVPDLDFACKEFDLDNLVHVFPERKNKTAYTKSLLEGDFYQINYLKESGNKVTLYCSSEFFGDKTISSPCKEVSDSFQQVYFTASQYRQLEYDLYGMRNK